MVTRQSRSTERETVFRTVTIVGVVTLFSLALAALVFLDASRASAEQSRAECNACCEKMGYDSYYEDQCKLKCFRNPEHCVAQAPKPKPQPQARKKKKSRRSKPSDEIVFRWPNPLTLTPGRERDAAAHILAVNGMPPNHPNYQHALRSIEGVLINFARANPQGGKLPTDQLVQILLKYR